MCPTTDRPNPLACLLAGAARAPRSDPVLVTGREDWIVLIGVLLLMGTALDVFVYTWLIRYQPPWLTGVVGLSELGFLFVLAHLLKLDLTDLEAIVFYVVSWGLAVATRIVLFPILSLTYLESATEFRRVEWSIPPAQEQLPVFAASAEGGAAGPVLRAAWASTPSA